MEETGRGTARAEGRMKALASSAFIASDTSPVDSAPDTAAREIAALPERMPENTKRGFVALQPRLFES